MTAPTDPDFVRVACVRCEYQEEVPSFLAAGRSDCPRCGGALMQLKVGARSSQEVEADRVSARDRPTPRDVDAEELAAQSAQASEAKHRAKMRARLGAAERDRRAKRAVLLGVIVMAVAFGALALYDRWDREQRIARVLEPDAALELARGTFGRRVALVRPFSAGPERHFVATLMRTDSGPALVRVLEGVEGKYVAHPAELPTDVDAFAEGTADASASGADRWERPALVDLRGDGNLALYAYAYLPREGRADSAYRVQLYLPARGTLLWMQGPPDASTASENLREEEVERRFLATRLRELGR